jgi:rfaE bifunctional protein nucleotidyltransferase chain/domain
MVGPEHYSGVILNLADAAILARTLQADGRRIVFTNGCFDLLHVGHVDLLARARLLGDCLFVGLNGDESVHLLKGPGRPVVAEQDRAAVLASMRAVDVVVVYAELTAERLVDAIRPDVYVKGGDWDMGQKVAPEAAVVASYGGRVVYLPYQVGRSTTQLLAQIREDPLPRG